PPASSSAATSPPSTKRPGSSRLPGHAATPKTRATASNAARPRSDQLADRTGSMVAEAIDLHPEVAQHRDVEVGQRRVAIADVAAGADATAGAAGEEDRQVVDAVDVAVGDLIG